MDERHWWIAGKVAECFLPNDDVSKVEDFICEASNLELIGRFLCSGGLQRLFVYSCDDSNDPLYLTDSLVNTGLDVATCNVLYFLRHDNERDLELAHVEREVFSGLIKGGRNVTVENLSCLLQVVYAPLAAERSQTSSKSNSRSTVAQQLKKLAATLTDTTSTTSLPTVKPVTLNKPADSFCIDLRPQKLSAVDEKTLTLCEQLITDWMNTIEINVNETDDQCFDDPNAGPLAELERWRRRLRLLTGVAEQLKSKEFKSVVMATVAAKSRLTRRWKQTDALLTDAINDAKDKVRFLESFERHFQQFGDKATPTTISRIVMPSFVNTILQMESIAKFYAQQGFLGLLFTKVTNQLVVISKYFIRSYTTDAEQKQGNDYLWKLIYDDATEQNNSLTVTDTCDKQVMKGQKDATSTADLRTRLESIVALHSGYIAALNTLASTLLMNKNSLKQCAVKDIGSSDGAMQQTNGVSLTDIDYITLNLRTFTDRVNKLLTIINTIQQFHILVKSSGGLPWPTDEDFELAAETVEHNEMLKRNSNKPIAEINEDNDEIQQQEQQSKKKLDTEPTDNDLQLLQSIKLLNSVPRLTLILCQHFNNLIQPVHHHLTTKMLLDTTGKEKDYFDDIYEDFSSVVHDAELFIKAYMNVVFMRKMKTAEALGIITRFVSVQNRLELRSLIMEHYDVIFVDYQTELMNIQQLFQQYKDSPVIARDASPVAGAVQWCRQLLRRVETPMCAFVRYCHPASLHLRGFADVLDAHNQLSATLSMYEGMLLARWKTGIESALHGLKSRLLVKSTDNKHRLIVNADKRLLELVQECRQLQRLGIKLPKSAKHIVKQGEHFKHYRDLLQQSIDMYHAACNLVPAEFYCLFLPHLDLAFTTLLPGLTALDWNSTNIDVFVHQIQSTAVQLQTTIKSVVNILINKIQLSIKSMSTTQLFDDKLATSTVWTTNGFTTAVTQSISSQINNISCHLSMIESAFHHIATALIPKVESSRVEFMKCDQIISFLLGHYNDAICDAIQSSITLSLNSLAELTGYNVSNTSDGQLTMVSDCLGTNNVSASLLTTNKPLDKLVSVDNQFFNSHHIQFAVYVQFVMPGIGLLPDLHTVQSALSIIATQIAEAHRDIEYPVDVNVGVKLDTQVKNNSSITAACKSIHQIINGMQQEVEQVVDVITKLYGFLWQDDARHNFSELLAGDGPQGALHAIQHEAQRLVEIENQLTTMSQIVSVKSICLHMREIRETLLGFTRSWKHLYTTALLRTAKRMKDEAVSYRASVTTKLHQQVVTLEQLNETLRVLEELRDKEGKMDQLYRPIEDMYELLKTYEPRLSRFCCKEVNDLRDEWQSLIVTSDHVTAELLREKRVLFEQELDKQIKAFVIEVIQFRNSFDATGPTVPGLTASEAADRLNEFTELYQAHDRRHQTLKSVAKLFGIECRPFPELDRTGHELQLLSELYAVYLPFLEFDMTFRQTLWSDVDLLQSHDQAKYYYECCRSMSYKLQDVDAYQTFQSLIHRYIDVFPVLHQLASKEIRNRHWLLVMKVTGHSFQLEAHVFQMRHLLDIGLEKHAAAVCDICQSARHELEIELQLKSIEDQWSEQPLTFVATDAVNNTTDGTIMNDANVPLLDVPVTEQLITELESTGVQLAVILTSRHIAPLHHTAAMWAANIKESTGILELWLNVQQRWQYLAKIFTLPAVYNMLQQVATKFQQLHLNWLQLMNKAYNIKHILQCCCMEEISQLSRLSIELDECTKSLSSYLDLRRRVFPRFYFLSDETLLHVISNPDYVAAIKPHLRLLFTSITDIQLTAVAGDQSAAAAAAAGDDGGDDDSDKDGEDVTCEENDCLVCDSERSKHSPLVASSVTNDVGEKLPLNNPVALASSVECWLAAVKQSAADSMCCVLRNVISTFSQGVTCEEWAYKYPGQVCCLLLLVLWSRDCERAVVDICSDRSALANVSKRFTALLARLQSTRSRTTWKHSGGKVTSVQRTSIDSMILYATFLRDIVENISRGKVRDVSDFEWKRNIRLHLDENEKQPRVCILNREFTYGCEFYSAVNMTRTLLLTERSITALSMSLAQCKGTLLAGDIDTTTDTVQTFGALLGRHVACYQCTASSDPPAVSNMLQGAAQDGCWICFTDFHNLGTQTTLSRSILVSHVEAVLRAVRSSLEFCFLSEEHEIPVNSGFSVFLTQPLNISLSSSSFNCAEISDLRSTFREVSLVPPDMRVLLRARCSRLGLKSPAVLATRFKIMVTLVTDQLPATVQPVICLPALLNIVDHAAALRQRNRVTLSAAEFKKLTSAIARSTNQMTSRQPTNIANTEFMSSPRALTKHPNAPKILSAAAKHEHAFVGQLLLDIIGPRFSTEHFLIFQQIVRDVFPSLPELPQITSPVSTSRVSPDRVTVARATVASRSMVPCKTWCKKCHQLSVVTNVHRGVIVIGPPGCGKSSVIQAMIDSRNLTSLSESSDTTASEQQQQQHHQQQQQHRLVRLYPLAADDLAVVFGTADSDGKWKDGVVTTAWKKAIQNTGITWLCLDGPLTSNWANHFITVLNDNKVLSLCNGDYLPVTSNIKLLFETDDISHASPAIVARSGIVYVDKDTVGWRPVAKTWLSSRTQAQRKILNQSFENVVDATFQYINKDSRLLLDSVTEVGLFTSCLHLLSAMLADNIGLSNELHIERLFIYCLMWTVGGLLDTVSQKRFSELLATLSPAMPDDDRDICIFDYYVDETGEWDSWVSRVPEASFCNRWNLLGDVFVDTIEMICIKLLMKLAIASGQSVLLVGPPGAGKTALIKDYLDTSDRQSTVVRRLLTSSCTSASHLQRFIESNITHRQGQVDGAMVMTSMTMCVGQVYGARDRKQLCLFIDDFNLAKRDESRVQRSAELLRRIMDEQTICTLSAPFECRTVEGLTNIVAMDTSDQSHCSSLHPRLLRHFTVFYLPLPTKATRKLIVGSLLEAAMLYGRTRQQFDVHLRDSITSASCSLLEAVMHALRPSSTPGRTHYLFTLKNIITCFNSFKLLADESRVDEKFVISLWKHEMERIVRDQLCRYADIQWFDMTMKQTIEQNWPDLINSLDVHFVTFSTDVVHQLFASRSKKNVTVLLQPVESLESVRTCIASRVSRHNGKFGNRQLNVMLTDNVLMHVIRLHRALTLQHSGNVLVVSPVGSQHDSLIQLALDVAGLSTHHINSVSFNTFLDSLRSAVRLAGTEGRKLVLNLTDKDLMDSNYIDAINSLLVSGECPFLFTNDELDSLLLALAPVIKSKHSNKCIDAMNYFLSCVKTNLHVVISLSPQHHLLSSAAREYRGLLTDCQVMWLCDWTKEALIGQAEYFIERQSVSKNIEQDIRISLSAVMANIHSALLVHCHQLPFTGELGSELELTIQTLPLDDKKKDSSRTLTVPNLPLSKLILRETIRSNHRYIPEGTACVGQLFIGPSMFQQLMETFHRIYSMKLDERQQQMNTIQKSLSVLASTRTAVNDMKEQIQLTTTDYQTASLQVTDIQTLLTAAVSKLELLKAAAGKETSLQLNQFLVDGLEEWDSDPLLQQGEKDEYDVEFDRMREAMFKSRHERATEELASTKQTIDQLKKKLIHAKEQVLFWKGRVNRQCVERVKAFQNPTLLVGHIVEMVMILIGRRPGHVTQGRESMVAYPAGEEQSGRFSLSSGSTGAAKKNKVSIADGASGERYSRQHWKTMQSIMNDAAKFVDVLHGIPWQDGLSPDIINGVEGYLAKNDDGQLGVTGEGTLLENAAEVERSFRAQRHSPSPSSDGGITIAAAKYSSEDAATLVQYTIAIVEYSRLSAPLRVAVNRHKELEAELAEYERQKQQAIIEEEKNKLESDRKTETEVESENMETVSQQVTELHSQLDDAIMEKHLLTTRLNEMKSQLKLTTSVLDSLKLNENEWNQFLKHHSDLSSIVADAVAAATFLTYCGGMSPDARKQIVDLCLTICKHHCLYKQTSSLFHKTSLADFLPLSVSVMTRSDVEEEQLPHSDLMLDNMCLVLCGDLTLTWPILCDPTCTAVDWLQQVVHNSQLVTTRHSNGCLGDDLLRCLSEGLSLFVTDIDVDKFASDAAFKSVILARKNFATSTERFKLWVDSEEIECSPKFRLYLHTSANSQYILPELAAHLSIIEFVQTRDDIEHEFHQIFINREKSRIHEETVSLLQERRELRQKIESLDKQILELISTAESDLLTNSSISGQLLDTKKQLEETLLIKQQTVELLHDVHKQTEQYRDIARYAAVCWMSTVYMRVINPLYHIAFRQFLHIYEAAICHSDRVSQKTVLERLVISTYMSVYRYLLEADKPIFRLLLALELEDCEGRVGAGEREFLISPTLGSFTMSSADRIDNTRQLATRKPFDWMQDEQFSNLHLLAAHYEWFSETFERMSRDGREMQWRTLCECDQPELAALPDHMNTNLSPLQCLLVIRAVRSDRLLHATNLFVNNILGKKCSADIPVDCGLLVRQSSPSAPVLLLYTRDPDVANALVADTATQRSIKLLTVTLNNETLVPTAQQLKLVQGLLTDAMAEGSWVFLQNGNKAPSLLEEIDSLLTRRSEVAPPVNSQFRCWVSAHCDSGHEIPTRLLQSWIKVTVDSPKTVKGTLLRGFECIGNTDLLRCSSRSDWSAVLHNVCMLHGLVRLRARFIGQIGWNVPNRLASVGFMELLECLRLVGEEFEDILLPDNSHQQQRNLSWNGVRTLLTDVIYGNFVHDGFDQKVLSSMVDFWMSQNSIRKDFEMNKVKYHLPTVLFSSRTRLQNIIQSLEAIPSELLETAEACHCSSEITLGDDQYLFTHLNKIYDNMPSSDSLAHKLFNISSQTFIGSAPTNITIACNRHELQQNCAVVASGSCVLLRSRKELDLHALCSALLSKIPQLNTKDIDKLKKSAGSTSFNIFMLNELEMMRTLLDNINISLQAIKAASEISSYGDLLSKEHCQIADDLYHVKIPERWRQLGNGTAPPAGHSVTQWFSDLQNRCTHYERILALGREKMPAYWLGAFFNPRGLLSLLVQDCCRYQTTTSRSGSLESYVFQTELTQRDKDHIRDPPVEGFFVFGLFLWGAIYDKSSSRLLDPSAPLPSRSSSIPMSAPQPNPIGPSPLPVIHVTCWPRSERPLPPPPDGVPAVTAARAAVTSGLEHYSCPVYLSRSLGPQHTIIDLELPLSGVAASKWLLKGLSATVRPY